MLAFPSFIFLLYHLIDFVVNLNEEIAKVKLNIYALYIADFVNSFTLYFYGKFLWKCGLNL